LVVNVGKSGLCSQPPFVHGDTEFVQLQQQLLDIFVVVVAVLLKRDFVAGQF
jgi:hypothetical protein